MHVDMHIYAFVPVIHVQCMVLWKCVYFILYFISDEELTFGISSNRGRFRFIARFKAMTERWYTVILPSIKSSWSVDSSVG